MLWSTVNAPVWYCRYIFLKVDVLQYINISEIKEKKKRAWGAERGGGGFNEQVFLYSFLCIVLALFTARPRVENVRNAPQHPPSLGYRFACHLPAVLTLVESGVCSMLLRSKYLQRDTSPKKVSIYAIVSLKYNIWQLFLDKCYIIMDILLPEAKKFRKGSENFYFCRSIAL